jgi:hypothetical protein
MRCSDDAFIEITGAHHEAIQGGHINAVEERPQRAGKVIVMAAQIPESKLPVKVGN